MKKSAETPTKDSDPKGAADAWLFQSPPGLANLLRKELNLVQAIERKQNLFIKRQRNHDLVFAGRVRSSDGLSRLRIAEAVYRCPIFGRYKISKRQLDVAAAELRELGPRRIVIQVAGKQFDRRDLDRWLAKELSARGAEVSEDVEDEVWMFCIDEAFYFGIPLKKSRDVAGREERIEEREGSLPPPVAAALVFAGQPKADDVVVDPVCGSGSLLAEARAYAPDCRRIGFDIDPKAVAVARANLKSDEQVKLTQGDSRSVKFFDAPVTFLMANLPFGVQYGDKKSNAELYEGILKNALKQADPARFRAVLLTSDTASLRTALAATKELETQDLFTVKIRGQVATAVLARVRI